jgi:hypothetical protein
MLVGGCADDDIVRYQIPKQKDIDRLNPAASPTAEEDAAHDVSTPAAAREPAQMLAAIVPHGELGWFFKLTGPPDAVGPQRERFESFLESLTFADEGSAPQWTLPEGWSAQPGSGLRYATLLIEDAQPPLELSVTSLAGPAPGEEEEYLLDNINRWREQLGLAKIDAGELGNESRSVACQGATATLVDLTGEMAAGGGMGRPPFAGGATGGLPPPGPSGDVPESLLRAPEGWQAGRADGMRKAAFDVVQGRGHVEITVIDLPKAGVDLLQQVNRWRGQVDLPDITADELADQLETLTVGKYEAKYVEALGDAKAVLAAVVEVGDTEWFFKLTGDVDLARQERERFREFVQSADMAALEQAR